MPTCRQADTIGGGPGYNNPRNYNRDTPAGSGSRSEDTPLNVERALALPRFHQFRNSAKPERRLRACARSVDGDVDRSLQM
jgi:hypothetical protein